ncbi:MAG: hypothetical protein AB1657_02270 [Candidatus Micrarchaeota archaeon]
MKDASGCPKEIAHAHSGKPAGKPRRKKFSGENPIAELEGGGKREMPKLVRMDREACLRQVHILDDERNNCKELAKQAATWSLESIEAVFGNSPRMTKDDIVVAADFVEKTDDATLRSMLEFEGYVGREREAITDLFAAIACGSSGKTKSMAYQELGHIGKPELLGFLLGRALEEGGEYIYDVLAGISGLCGKCPQEKERVVETLKPLLSDADSSIRWQTALFFIGFTEKSGTLVLGMLARERDGRAAKAVLDQIGRLNGNELWDATGHIARAINRHIGKNPRFASTFVNIAPAVDMEKLVGILTPESRRLLEERIKPGMYDMVIFNHLLTYRYFMAACEGRLIETEVMGNRFKYFLLPAKVLDNHGRVNERAIAISEDVPENLRQIVAYHEFVEGRTRSHEKAIEAEMEAVRSLGLEAEYKEWLARLDPEVVGKQRGAYL